MTTRWRRAAPMLALAVGGPVLLDASAAVAARGFSWGALAVPAVILLPLTALVALGRPPTTWWQGGFVVGLVAGCFGGYVLGLRWPVWDGWPSALPGLALGVLVAWLMDLAGRDWIDPPAAGSGLRRGPKPLRHLAARTRGTDVPPVG